MDTDERLAQHERSIGRIEGRLESLATKDFVRKEVNDAVKIIDAKIDKQTEVIGNRFEELSDKIEKERSWRMKITGGASILALLFVASSSLITTLVSIGIITP
ncbi:MAG: hypothetical protein OXG68_17040 [Chloroflexi bacterium]|nr:hypothetical protein [Chloroflexota bacterium]